MYVLIIGSFWSLKKVDLFKLGREWPEAALAIRRELNTTAGSLNIYWVCWICWDFLSALFEWRNSNNADRKSHFWSNFGLQNTYGFFSELVSAIWKSIQLGSNPSSKFAHLFLLGIKELMINCRTSGTSDDFWYYSALIK